jgi:hypothetical protein
VLAALTNALRVVGKDLKDVRIVMAGAGAAGTAVLKLLLSAGARNVISCDIDGAVYQGREDLNENLEWIAAHTNPGCYAGDLKGAVIGADVFIGVSAPNVIGGDDVKNMAPGAIVFALANPDPEVDPDEAREYAAVVATGRSDYPNQINNVLAFPGVFRGLLDAVDHDHRRHAGRGGAGARRRGPRRGTRPRLHHPVGLPPGRGLRRGRRGQGRRSHRGDRGRSREELILKKAENRRRSMAYVTTQPAG